MRNYSLVFAMLVLFSLGANGQYYYKDIHMNRQTNEEMARYKSSKLRNIKIKSLESDGSESEGFVCQKKFTKDYRKSELFTRTGQIGASLLESYYNDKGQIISNYDSSETNVSRTQFDYDETGRLFRIQSHSKSVDDDYVNELDEEHVYIYNGEKLEKMYKIKNRTDTAVILFSTDEQDRVILEKDTKTAAKYYYYYDEQGRLTDVAHANEYRQKMVADYVFEYNPQGQVASMTVTEEGGNDYFVWRYNYDNNLRVRERMFNSDRKLMGTIEYEYK